MLQNLVGQAVPQVDFRTHQGYEWVNLSSDEIFKAKTVIVFSLPGAFTPTCSSSHVPRFDQLAKRFKALGVDDIVCISVNDAFVMKEWQESQRAMNIRFLPDGNGEFTSGMGMLVNKEDLGFGKRSWRYSMLVRDGIIAKMFIESEVPGDPYDVSDADTMLNYLAPESEAPLDVSVFTRKGCPLCAKAKNLLQNAGIEYEELLLNKNYSDRTLRAVSHGRTFPQVFINGENIGGSDDLQEWLARTRATLV